MTYEQSLWAAALIGVWCFGLALLCDRRWARWALSRSAEGPAATRRMVRRSQLRWLSLWLVVWVLGIALAKEDPNNLEASVVVVPMVMAYGPRAIWFIWNNITDLVGRGADPEVARAVFRGGTPPAVLGAFLCLAALGVTFRG